MQVSVCAMANKYLFGSWPLVFGLYQQLPVEVEKIRVGGKKFEVCDLVFDLGTLKLRSNSSFELADHISS